MSNAIREALEQARDLYDCGADARYAREHGDSTTVAVRRSERDVIHHMIDAALADLTRVEAAVRAYQEACASGDALEQYAARRALFALLEATP